MNTHSISEETGFDASDRKLGLYVSRLGAIVLAIAAIVIAVTAMRSTGFTLASHLPQLFFAAALFILSGLCWRAKSKAA